MSMLFLVYKIHGLDYTVLHSKHKYMLKPAISQKFNKWMLSLPIKEDNNVCMQNMLKYGSNITAIKITQTMQYVSHSGKLSHTICGLTDSNTVDLLRFDGFTSEIICFHRFLIIQCL